MAGYVFLSNSTKPSKEQQNSREIVKLTNVSRPCLQVALDMGFDVYFGVNRANPENLECELPVKLYDSHTYRSIFAFKDNKIAYDNLKNVVKKNSIKVIHCNTPVGGLIGRVVGKRYNVNKIIYTVHGFHFYNGAPLFNRTVVKWAEMIMAHWTDVIITMNQEDYEAAKKLRLRNNGKVYYIPGVGIDTKAYKNVVVDKLSLRTSLGIKDTDIVCISMGDLIPRKNYSVAIKAISECKNKKIHYLICGKGPELEKLQNLAIREGVKDQVHFLGFRTDIKELLQISDIFLFTTLQEGMPRSMMEAMASGLPCIASRIRGNIDLLEDKKGGYLVSANDVKEITDKLQVLISDIELRKKMSEQNLIRIKNFDIVKVKEIIGEIYREELRF